MSSYARSSTHQIEKQLHILKQTDHEEKLKTAKQKQQLSADMYEPGPRPSGTKDPEIAIEGCFVNTNFVNLLLISQIISV